MKVRELVARLASANPEDTVVIDTDSRCLLLLNQRSGMFQPLDFDERDGELTDRDKEFLSSLRVRF